MRELLCNAFCASLDVRQVPAGYAVTTPYANADGDRLLIYLVRHGNGRWRIEDDGTQVPLLEAHGVDLGGRPRGEAFNLLLETYGMRFDPDERTLCSPALDEAEIGEAAIRFLGLVLRLQDLSLLNPQIVRSAFREDALAAIHSAFDESATIEEQAKIVAGVGYEADVIIRTSSAPPVGVYFATSEERALQSIVVKMETDKYKEIASSIILLLERAKANPVKESTLSLALARLDAVVSLREAPEDSMTRIAQAAKLPLMNFSLQ